MSNVSTQVNDSIDWFFRKCMQGAKRTDVFWCPPPVATKVNGISNAYETPVPVAGTLLDSCSPPGCTVVDFACGSGSTSVACRLFPSLVDRVVISFERVESQRQLYEGRHEKLTADMPKIIRQINAGTFSYGVGTPRLPPRALGLDEAFQFHQPFRPQRDAPAMSHGSDHDDFGAPMDGAGGSSSGGSGSGLGGLLGADEDEVGRRWRALRWGY